MLKMLAWRLLVNLLFMSMFVGYCFIIKEAFVSRHYEEVC